jgi:hypothetical protein
MNFLSTVLAQAGESVSINAPTELNIVSGASVSNWISWAITLILLLAGVIFFFMLVIGGIKWIMSGGDKGSTESARNQITAALIGLIIVFAAWAIITLIKSVFGVDILNFTIPGLTTVGGGGGS